MIIISEGHAPVGVEEGVVVADGVEAEADVVGGESGAGVVPGEILHRALLPLDLLLDLLAAAASAVAVGGWWVTGCTPTHPHTLLHTQTLTHRH